MEEYYDQPINISTDWGGDENTNGLPVTGRRVQEFIKNELASKATKDIATTENDGLMSKDDKGKISELDAITKGNENEFIVADDNENIIAKIDKNGMMTTEYSSEQFQTMDNGKSDFVVCDKYGNIIFRVGKNLTTYDQLCKTIKEKYNQPAISWIDDDFNIYDTSSGEIKPIYSDIHQWCIDNNIRFDFAYIPRQNEAHLALAQSWEDEGFGMLMHPKHDGWYNYADNTHDIVKVRKSFVECVRLFKNNFASKGNILVYPGSSNSFPENVDFIKQYVECAITATEIGVNKPETDPYQFVRLTLSISASKTKTETKKLIKEYIDNGYWVILYTHLYNHHVSDVVDETTNSSANLKEIVEYANSLCPIKLTQGIWEKRKFMYNFK